MLTNFAQPRVLVTGATSQIGQFLLPRLQAAGFIVTALSRQPQPNSSGIIWQSIDLLTSPLPANPSNPTWEVLFHLAPLPLLATELTHFPTLAVKKIIAFSSTSRMTKTTSSDPKERSIATQLITAEQTIMTWCQAHQVTWILFRPTLIYGCGRDNNVTFIARFIRRFGFFPVLGEGCGLRQPVHADDLAAACIQACLSPLASNQAYNLSGGQTLSYREMVEAIFHQLGKKPRIISIPLPIFRGLLRGLTWLPSFTHLSTGMITRMNQNLCFDHTAAYQHFGYCPRTFSDQDMGF